MSTLEVIAIVVVCLLALYLYARLAAEAPRFLLGLNTAHCPHCQKLDSLTTVDAEITILDASLPNGQPLVCRNCGQACSYTDIFPDKTPENEPAPTGPKAA